MGNSEQKNTYKFDHFITKDMFLDLSGCVLIVCAAVQVLKCCCGLNPMLLNLLVSIVVTFIRIIFMEDFSLGGIILGFLNLIPILLGASGAYEVMKNLSILA